MKNAVAWTMKKGDRQRSYAVVGSTLYRWTDLPVGCTVYYSASWLARNAAHKQTERDESEGFVMVNRPFVLAMDGYGFATEAVDNSTTDEETRSAVGALISVIMLDGATV